jgi:hypothetical protein
VVAVEGDVSHAERVQRRGVTRPDGGRDAHQLVAKNGQALWAQHRIDDQRGLIPGPDDRIDFRERLEDRPGPFGRRLVAA